jgi:hypothetical protein
VRADDHGLRFGFGTNEFAFPWSGPFNFKFDSLIVPERDVFSVFIDEGLRNSHTELGPSLSVRKAAPVTECRAFESADRRRKKSDFQLSSTGEVLHPDGLEVTRAQMPIGMDHGPWATFCRAGGDHSQRCNGNDKKWKRQTGLPQGRLPPPDPSLMPTLAPCASELPAGSLW